MAKRPPPPGDNYDKLMTLQSVTETVTKGTAVPSTSDLADMWCSLTPLQGREYWNAQQVQSETTHVIRTWYRTDVTPTTKMQFLYRTSTGTRTFRIASFVNIDEANVEWEFRVVETA